MIPPHPEYEFTPAEHLKGGSHLAIAAPALERSDGGRHIRLRISDDKGQMIVFDGEAPKNALREIDLAAELCRKAERMTLRTLPRRIFTSNAGD